MSEKLKEVGRKVKLQSKHILHIDDTQQKLAKQDDNTLSKIETNKGFNPANTLNAESSTPKQILDQLPQKIRQVPHLIRHPQKAAEGKTARQLATSEQPYLNKSDDEKFLDANEKLEGATGVDDVAGTKNARVRDLQARVDSIENDREQKKVAWFSSRYAHRARVLQMGQDKFPISSPLRWADEKGILQGREWSQWLTQLLVLGRGLLGGTSAIEMVNAEDGTAWDQDMILQQVERIVMASSPAQRRLMQMRKLQRWTNPTKTATWFAVWLVVWYYNRVFSFAYGFGLYQVTQKFAKRNDSKAMKQSHGRIGDNHGEDEEIETLGELIDQHGSSNWMKPLMDSVLPIVQPIVKDWADWMEVMTNFWQYEDVRATTTVFAVLGFALLFSTFSSTELCVRLSTLVAILRFFTQEPLSHGHPRYLQVLLPAQWIFWSTPTHLEVSFKYLRQKAEFMKGDTVALGEHKGVEDATVQAHHDHVSKPDSPTSIDDVLFATDCHWKSKSGSFMLTAQDLHFVQKFPQKALWSRPVKDLVQLKKGDGKTSVMKSKQNFLEMNFQDGSSERLEQLEDKDKVFNVVIGFSKMPWQQLPL